MSNPAFMTLLTLLRFCAVLETGTGIALMSAPAVVVALLVRTETSDLATLLGRCLGIALLALALACWPERQPSAPSAPMFRAMLTYNGLMALVLAYVGVVAGLGGPLLWPACALHTILTVLLLWRWRSVTVRGDHA